MLNMNWHRGRASIGITDPMDWLLNHPNLAALYIPNYADSVTTDGGNNPGVIGQNITGLADLSPNGRDLDQFDLTARPPYSEDGSGKRSVHFAGNDRLQSNVSTPCSTTVIAVSSDSTVNYGRALVMNNGTYGSPSNAEGVFRPQWFSPYKWWTPTNFALSYNRLWQNKVLIDTPAYSSLKVYSADNTEHPTMTHLAEGLQLGDLGAAGDYYWRGHVYFLAFFNAVLSDADRDMVENIAAGEAGITF